MLSSPRRCGSGAGTAGLRMPPASKNLPAPMKRPSARIVVTGCAAQTQAQMFADMAEVDRVVGNDDKMRSDAWLNARTALDGARRVNAAASDKIAVSDIMSVRQMA